ncbi:MAG: hypothetical protein PUP46_09470 [Endozoicomonas sp. (ex Botrylloides leachii)]|nr:hypothetical protein [Endozoicomonas sp. (ex Botrylloides leachii)]
MDFHSRRSCPSSQNKSEGASVDEAPTFRDKQYKTITSEHGLSHRVRLDKTSAALDKPLPKINIEPNINLVIDKRHRLLIEDDAGQSLPPEQEWRVRQNHRDDMLSLLNDFASCLNSELQRVLNIHLLTPLPTQELADDCLFTPLNERAPTEPVYQQKTWVDTLLPWRANKINATNNALTDQFLHQKKAWQKKVSQHREDYLKFWNNRLSTSQSMEEFLYRLLSKTTADIGVETKLSVDKAASIVWIDVHFPEMKMLPGLEYKVLDKELRLTCKSLSPTKKRQYYMQQVHSIGFRLIGEVFSALPGLKQVVFSGYGRRLNPATAHLQKDYLYSVRVDREQWEGINFQLLPELLLTEVMAGFDLRRNMSKTGIFKAIEPFLNVRNKQSDIFATQQDVIG